MLVADQFMISDEDREKLQSAEVLLALPRFFSLCNFQFTNLKWMQSLSAGNVDSCHNSVTLLFYLL